MEVDNTLNIIGLYVLVTSGSLFVSTRILRYFLLKDLKRFYSNKQEFDKIVNTLNSFKKLDKLFVKYSVNDTKVKICSMLIRFLDILGFALLIIGGLLYLFGGMRA